MDREVAVVAALRTPFCRAAGRLASITADQLAVFAVRELLAKNEFSRTDVDLLVFGNVAQHVQSSNIARIIAVKSGLPQKVPAYTVNSNCASGMQAISDAAMAIMVGSAEVAVAGGVESMSNIPITFHESMNSFLQQLNRAKTLRQKLACLQNIRPKMFYPQLPSLCDPLCGLTMGQTAELLAREFGIDRSNQDHYALQSQQRASAAESLGYFADEIVPLLTAREAPLYRESDDGIRKEQKIEALASLPPVFNKLTGTITAGNSSQVTDGAAALLLMSAEKAAALGYTPLGYIRSFAYSGVEPRRMGLGPLFATAKLLERSKMALSDFNLIELNEAFAAQVLACKKASASKKFAKEELGRSEPLGEFDEQRLNVNGGAIALGHPLGASGARLVLTLLMELRRRKQQWGLATLCVGGGQGGAMIVEAR